MTTFFFYDSKQQRGPVPSFAFHSLKFCISWKLRLSSFENNSLRTKDCLFLKISFFPNTSFGVSIFKKATIPILPELNDIFFWTNTKLCSPKRLSFALMKIDFLFLTLCFFLDGKVNEKEKWSTELNRWKGGERIFPPFFLLILSSFFLRVWRKWSTLEDFFGKKPKTILSKSISFFALMVNVPLLNALLFFGGGEKNHRR